jgi:hypothetical protein
VDADILEKAVMWELFSLFGNPVAVEKALKEATPNADKADVYQKKLERAKSELDKISSRKQTILNLIAKDDLTEDEASNKLKKLKEDEALFIKERDAALKDMEGMLSPQEIKKIAEGFTGSFQKANLGRKWATQFKLNNNLDGMSWDERRSLLQMVFGGVMPDGRKMGVYVSPAEGERGQRTWPFRIMGRLVDLERQTNEVRDADGVGGAYMQRRLLKECRTS